MEGYIEGYMEGYVEGVHKVLPLATIDLIGDNKEIQVWGIF